MWSHQGQCIKYFLGFFCCRLLHVLNANCKYAEADATLKEAQVFVDKLESLGQSVNKAVLYSECCALLFAKSLYDEVGGFKLITL